MDYKGHLACPSAPVQPLTYPFMGTCWPEYIKEKKNVHWFSDLHGQVMTSCGPVVLWKEAGVGRPGNCFDLCQPPAL